MTLCSLALLLLGPTAIAQPAPQGPPSIPTDSDELDDTDAPDERPARLIQLVQPEWPAGAQADGPFLVEAYVHVEPDGHPTAVFLVDELPATFRVQAREALLSSTFAPATVDGEPVAGDVRVTIRFDPPPQPTPAAADTPVQVIVVEAKEGHPSPDRGIGDHRVDVQRVQAVGSTAPDEALKLAPSVFISRLGSDVHPSQIFLRGFDARHGQDLAFSVDGVPLNQVGNPHGHGLVDLNPVPAEAMAGLRVVEGPFDPAQGDFAVAGSVEVGLGLAQPGLLIKGQGGSFGTGRAVVGWQHETQPGSFAVAELMQTRGYGDNRGARKASALVRHQRGDRFVLAGAYASAYELPGVVRAVDVEAGRIDRFATADPNQGGSFQQAFAAAGVEGRTDDGTAYRLRLGAALRHQRLRSNFTGFLTDDRRAGESQHDQRGDLTDQGFRGTTVSLDSAMERGVAIARGVEGTVRAGLSGRLDDVAGRTWRVAALDLAPYRVEADYLLRQANVGLFAELETRAGPWTLRAGGRAEGIVYDLTDLCAARDEWFPGAEVDDVNCPDEGRNGPRLRAGARTASGLALQPRGSLLFQAHPDHQLSVAAGRGFRSLEALALSEDEDSPLGQLWGAEAGWRWTKATERLTAITGLAAYTTHVDRDLIFDETEVRNVVAGQTHRYGATATQELNVGALTQRAALTYTYAVFGDELPPSYSSFSSDRQAGQLVPYIPPWVARVDVIGRLTPPPSRLGPDLLRLGLAADWISPRPLPQSERSATVFTVDLQASVARGPLELALALTNLFDARYPLAEFNFASWFPDVSGQPFPTRIASRQIVPGAPRAALASLTYTPGRTP